jgi:hypothetical protein
MKLGPRPAGNITRWTPADDEQLLALLASKMNNALIARKLKRSLQAVSKRKHILSGRLVEIGLKAEEMKDSVARRPWTPQDQEKLDALLDAGREADEIAVTLNRTPQAVYARLQRRYRKQARLPALSRSGLKAKK